MKLLGISDPNPFQFLLFSGEKSSRDRNKPQKVLPFRGAVLVSGAEDDSSTRNAGIFHNRVVLFLFIMSQTEDYDDFVMDTRWGMFSVFFGGGWEMVST